MKKIQNDNPWESRTFRMQIGMVASLAFVLVAFEWKTSGEKALDILGGPLTVYEDSIITPITRQEMQPPKVVAPVIVEVPENEPIEETKIELIFEDPKPEDRREVFVPKQIEEEPITDEPFLVVEQNAVPKEGMAAFYQFLGKQLRYPKQAKRMGIQGKVYIQFVIETDGRLTDIQAIKGIGAGCDEEAVRVLSLSPAWEAGRQRGRAVRQRMVIPLTFKLN